MNEFVATAFQVARKEFLQHLRTKRLFIILGFLIAILVLFLFVFGPRIARGNPLPNTSGEHFVLAIYLSGLLVGGLAFTQLTSIVLTADAVCSEWSQRTIFLLLSKPLSRSAFVVGKFVGNLFTIVVAIVGVFTVAYLAMQPAYDGGPSGDEVLGFFGMLGFVLLGCAAFASLALFFSAITKSNVTSLLMMLGLWLLAFPMIGAIGIFSNIGERDFDFDDASVQGWLYLNPAADMQAGLRLLVPDATGQERLEMILHSNPLAVAPNNLLGAALALVTYTVVFLAATLVVVRRRNFE